jgi:cysteine desulfurase
MKLPIYLDYSATTPVDSRVATKMMACLSQDGIFGNSGSRSHAFGWKADEAIEIARNQVAELINADPREIVWTSGATEANNLAIKGVAEFYSKKGKHIITSTIEHKAVLDPCRDLERLGYDVTYLAPNKQGIIAPEQVKNALRDDTILVSLMHVNNEIGAINDIAAIGEITRNHGVLFHVDSVQSLGKLPINMQDVKVDLLSISAHKCYGPKGVGVLFVRRKPRVRIQAQILGGGQERGMRSGTLATHQIVGMGEACAIAKESMTEEYARIKKLRQQLIDGIQDLEAIQINGDINNGIASILNISFAYIEGESLMMSLSDIAVSSGSACTSASLEPSYVLRSLGLEDDMAHSSIRFSIGRFTTEEEIQYTIKKIRSAVKKLRDLSPLWDMYKEGIDLKTVQWAEH